MGIKFGPAGLGPVATAEEILQKYHDLGLRACEIAFTYSVYIKNKEDAVRIGKKAKDLGIELSIHAPYWINLNSSEKDKIESSKKRIIDCCEVGELLGAKVVVFHSGFYGKKEKEESYQIIRDGVKEVVETVRKNGWKIKVAPETMGKVNVFGSVDDISRLVKDTGCAFCIDFAHILARYGKVDYDMVEKAFPYPEWHVHFLGIVYGDKGEKHHVPTPKSSWKDLLSHLPKDKEIRIVNESPTLVEDSVEGLKMYEGMK